MRKLFLVLLFLPPVILFSASATTIVKVPVDYYKLQNGLKVIISAENFAPVVAVGVYYNIGSRSDPKGQSGFAHLFEHLMFEGTDNISKSEFSRLIEGNGGSFEGFTKMDFTTFYQMLPAENVETALWLEADRMQHLKLTEENLRNQKDVVQQEIRQSVTNEPYALFQWYDLWQEANQNWYNKHNVDLSDVENATVEMAEAFYQRYYAPNNAVLVVAGDVELPVVKKMVEKYFAKIPSKQIPTKPVIQEPPQGKQKQLRQKDKLANLPALAIGYHMPSQDSPDYAPLVLLNTILEGDPGSSPFHPLEDPGSRLYRRLVKEKQLCLGWSGAINLNPWNMGNEFDYSGPMLLTMYGIYKEGVRAENVIENIDEVIGQIQTQGVTAKELDSAKVRFRSDYYDQLESLPARANLLASFALFSDDPDKINTVLDAFMKVSSSDIMAAATKYLIPTNRTIIDRIPEGQK